MAGHDGILYQNETLWVSSSLYKKEQLDFDTQPFVCFRVCFLLCLQELKTSSLEFKVASCGLYIIQYFSRRQSLQTPVTGLKPFALPKTFQLNSYGIYASFRNQMYLLSIVLFMFFILWYFVDKSPKCKWPKMQLSDLFSLSFPYQDLSFVHS